MKRYAQFLEWGKTCNKEALGSDSVFILDARNRIEIQIADAKDRIDKLRNVQPQYIGYRIMEGSRFDEAKVVTEGFYHACDGDNFCGDVKCVFDFAGNMRQAGCWADWCRHNQKIYFGGKWGFIPPAISKTEPTEDEVLEIVKHFDPDFN